MSRYGVTFNGKNSKDLGLIMKSDNRQLLPSTKDRYVDIPTMNGTHLFSDGLQDRFIDIQFGVIEDSLHDIRRKARDIARWLFTRKRVQLIFDDEPDKFYMAKVANQLDLEEQITKTGRFTVTFRCLPLAQLIEDATNYTLDSEIQLDNDVMLGDEYSFSITQPTTVELNNFGSDEVKPIIRVIGSFSTLSITVDGVTFQYNQAFSGELEINNEKYIVKSGTTNKIRATNGEFITLQEGINQIEISGSNLNCEVVFVFKPQYL